LKTLLTQHQLDEGVSRLASEISHYYRGQPLAIVGVLTGSIVFLADLIRRLNRSLRLGLVQASSYRGAATSPGELVIHTGLLPELKGQHLLLVDDIYDTGLTLDGVIRQLIPHGPLSVRSVVLLRKHGRKIAAIEPDHVGFEIPNEFVVGYGLDYRGAYRNLPYVASLEAAELSDTPELMPDSSLRGST